MATSVETQTTDLAHSSFVVRGIHCEVCAATLAKVVGEIPGVFHAEVDPAFGRTQLDYDRREISEEELEGLVEAAGYELVPVWS
jgi:copper chaperone